MVEPPEQPWGTNPWAPPPGTLPPRPPQTRPGNPQPGAPGYFAPAPTPSATRHPPLVLSRSQILTLFGSINVTRGAVRG